MGNPENLSTQRPFGEGETIYDVDGNAYVVKNCRAVMTVAGSSVSYFLGRTMSGLFSRDNPRAKATSV